MTPDPARPAPERDPAFMDWTTQWGDAFFDACGLHPRPSVHFLLQKGDFPDPTPERRPPRTLLCREDNGALAVHIHKSRAYEMPFEVFGAVLDLELALFVLSRSPETFAFNFKKKILVEIPLTGSALQILRHMIWLVEIALKHRAATRLLLNLGRGRGQVQRHFFDTSPCTRDRDDYERLEDRAWVRCLYMCRKAEAYLSADLLEKAGACSGLLAHWDQCHDFILPYDRLFLERAAGVPARVPATDHAGRVHAIFTEIRTHFSI